MSILEIIVFLPLIAALAIGLGAPARFTALGTSLLVLVMSLVTAIQFKTNVEGTFQFTGAPGPTSNTVAPPGVAMPYETSAYCFG